MFLSLLAIAQR